MTHPIFAEALENFSKIPETIARAERSVPLMCAQPIEMTDTPLKPHMIGSRPNDCFTCLRTRENAR